jgi:hypothetical protein
MKPVVLVTGCPAAIPVVEGTVTVVAVATKVPVVVIVAGDTASSAALLATCTSVAWAFAFPTRPRLNVSMRLATAQCRRVAENFSILMA